MLLVILAVIWLLVLVFAVALVRTAAKADRAFRDARRRLLTLAELNAAWDAPARDDRRDTA